MEMVNLFLPSTNQFATDYSTGNSFIRPLFHYQFQETESYQERVKDLENINFKREELADYIGEYMSKFPSSDEVVASISKLRNPDSVVVIGGQQAGILTGPLYSIHKILSIILFAKKQEAELSVPVVPVFWIAGEDHDYDEVNHIFVEKENQLEKSIYPEKVLDKRMVSHIEIKKDVLKNWVIDIISSYGETKHTKSLLQFADAAIENSVTFVDFFAHITMSLFKEYGLLIVDSGDKGLRKLEKEYFINQIKSTKEITEKVKKKQQELEGIGMSQTIVINDSCANLFYYDEVSHERILLDYIPEQKQFVGANGSISFSYDEMLEIASEFPERLSNNVVTRPLMQECLFPTLAFIAGPGEIAYWAELKEVFEHFDMKMPPIVPRLNISLIERNVSSDMEELGLKLEDVLTAGTGKQKELFLDANRDSSFQALFAQTKDQLVKNYLEIEKKTEQHYKGMLPLLKKNESLLLKQIDFMENRLELALLQKHEVVIEKYNRIERRLKPSGSPQERIWNLFYFLNQYGLSFIDELLTQSYLFDGSHQVVKL
jgi:bacillithiol biosynthesis cysteine-adding enzyme BshC